MALNPIQTMLVNNIVANIKTGKLNEAKSSLDDLLEQAPEKKAEIENNIKSNIPDFDLKTFNIEKKKASAKDINKKTEVSTPADPTKKHYKEIDEIAKPQTFSLYPSSRALLKKARIKNAPALSDAKYLQNIIFKEIIGKDLFDIETGEADEDAWNLCKEYLN